MLGLIDELPFGGVQTSGLGSYHGIHSFHSFSRAQGVVVRGIKTDLPNLIRYKHHSADYNSKAAWIARWVLTYKLPSNLKLKMMNYFRKLGGYRLVLVIASAVVGYVIGNRK